MRLLQNILSYIPRRLPVGMTEFEKMADRIISLSGEFADRDSMKYALAAQILNLGPQKSRVPDQYFVRSMVKAAANQIASQAFQDIKAKQQEAVKKAQEAAEKEKADEATTATQAVMESVE